MRFSFRKLLILPMHLTGLIRLFRFFHRNQIVILMIHGVMDEKDNPSWTPLRPQLSRDKLEEYLGVLSKRYHFISLADAVEMLSGRRAVSPYSVVLTFDDGYRNNLTHALPILRRYNAPATFFVPTGFINNPKPFWFDRLDYALQQTDIESRKVEVGSLSMSLEGGGRKTLRESYKKFRRSAKKQKISDHEFLRGMERLSESLEAESGRSLADIQQNDDFSAIMSWEDIKNNCNNDMTIGSHTVDHIRLDKVETETAHYQLAKSRQDIEIHTGKPCQGLCYPNGGFNEETVKLARECGYVCGLTTEEGLNKSGDDLMRLKRIALPINTSITGLLALVSGASMAINNLKGRLLYCGGLLKKICKLPIYSYRLIQARGIRKATIHLGNELYAEKEFIVTKHSLNAQEEIQPLQTQLDISEVTKNDTRDIEDICAVWPSEFGYWRPEGLKSKLIQDMEDGDWCFVVRLDNNIVGSILVTENDEKLSNCRISHSNGERVIKNVFVVPWARGMGLGKCLINYSVQIAIERKVPYLFAFTLPNRVPSLRAQFGVGFEILGLVKVVTRFGRNEYLFRHANGLHEKNIILDMVNRK